ncbi:hypothetical protein [Polaribacter dokdonensis]|uniref:Uncharacterized protein n=1 Tax=Polaribacter dokdonensis DSW-5 TaxID=1300348 RepID=A0A0M9CI71_9FLAO|nr:hypothetical protein [Polaribacter dokdonensis]KOY53003.1 hypothetical protein I602_2563 [Polaribacter dokdonensis DSW-5]SEE55803.1 hypothetical protein SAMN05444353_2338 [Polaribacter dokdonensis DSW-5]
MDLASLNVTQKKKNSKSDVVPQITKRQLNTLLELLATIVFVSITLLAINLDSPFIKELLICESIILMILFIKTSNSNKIKK